MDGWIKLHRSFLSHWLCAEHRPLTKREAWETMLFAVNYDSKKVLVNNSLIDCNRGQSVLSIDSWAKKFNWTTGQVRHFFKLLESDGMILVEGMKYTTRLTICNYDKYQDEQLTDDKLTTNSEQTDNKLTTTTKERKEIKKNKKSDTSSFQSSKEYYENELKNLPGKNTEMEDNYKIFVNFILGNNDYERALDKVLLCKWQVPYSYFPAIYTKFKNEQLPGGTKKKITTILQDMDKWTNLKPEQTDVQKTIISWLGRGEHK